MICFLTSSPTGPLDHSYKVEGLDSKNHFIENLKHYWKENSRCCLIAASPDNFQQNDEMCHFFKNAFLKSNFSLSTMDLYDHRYTLTKEKLQSYDVILLGGGHVPTQNQFFQEIHLKEMIENFDGIIIGISAGSMNSSQVVYAQPELPGEATNPNYQRWLPGLNLTNVHILPHYQMVKDTTLDSLKLFEDITYPDSINHEFLVLEDGSYLLIDQEAIVYGKSYLLHDQKLDLLCHENESKRLKK